ncbi:hypothetical protein ANTPLA_LOCUS7498 [Anthophora plagiata]
MTERRPFWLNFGKHQRIADGVYKSAGLLEIFTFLFRVQSVPRGNVVRVRRQTADGLNNRRRENEYRRRNDLFPSSIVTIERQEEESEEPQKEEKERKKRGKKRKIVRVVNRNRYRI